MIEKDRSELDSVYEDALNRVSRNVGVPADELRRALQREVRDMRGTAECVSIDEIQTYVTGVQLGPDRLRHISSCEFCTSVLQAADSRDIRAERDVAALAANPSSAPAALRKIGAVVVAFAVAVGVVNLLKRV